MITQSRARARPEAQANDQGLFTLPDGDEVLVRETVPEDARGLQETFVRCSRETIYLRFHMAWLTVPEWAIELLMGAGDIDRDGRAIVALEGEKIVGHAMYVKDSEDDREAEVAVIVEDGRQSGGVGRLLLSRITREARRVGVEVLTCTTLGNNYRLLSIVRRAFPGSRTSYADGACKVRIPLKRPEGEKVGNGGTIR